MLIEREDWAGHNYWLGEAKGNLLLLYVNHVRGLQGCAWASLAQSPCD